MSKSEVDCVCDPCSAAKERARTVELASRATSDELARVRQSFSAPDGLVSRRTSVYMLNNELVCRS